MTFLITSYETTNSWGSRATSCGVNHLANHLSRLLIEKTPCSSSEAAGIAMNCSQYPRVYNLSMNFRSSLASGLTQNIHNFQVNSALRSVKSGSNLDHGKARHKNLHFEKKKTQKLETQNRIPSSIDQIRI